MENRQCNSQPSVLLRVDYYGQLDLRRKRGGKIKKNIKLVKCNSGLHMQSRRRESFNYNNLLLHLETVDYYKRQWSFIGRGTLVASFSLPPSLPLFLLRSFSFLFLHRNPKGFNIKYPFRCPLESTKH